MNRRPHLLQRQFVTFGRLAPEKRFESVGRLQPPFPDIHLQRAKPPDIERGLQRGLVFNEVLQDAAGSDTAAAARERRSRRC